jgi:hypothetical protein
MLRWSFSDGGSGQVHAPVAAQYVGRVRPLGGTLSHYRRLKTSADPLYQHPIVTAERKFWRCPAAFIINPRHLIPGPNTYIAASNKCRVGSNSISAP